MEQTLNEPEFKYGPEVIEQLDNIMSTDSIKIIRETISETLMDIAAKPLEQRPSTDFVFFINQYYYLLKVLEPLQKLKN